MLRVKTCLSQSRKARKEKHTFLARLLEVFITPSA